MTLLPKSSRKESRREKSVLLYLIEKQYIRRFPEPMPVEIEEVEDDATASVRRPSRSKRRRLVAVPAT